ncbi:hypothetical protein [Mucilaginibacter sp. CSA2-8R]|uniref:hypothetical protein n=1 Tax=Mucilaginibacter sp. CSA2-8R TaxID=3141542 RepID=UPI00315D089D
MPPTKDEILYSAYVAEMDVGGSGATGVLEESDDNLSLLQLATVKLIEIEIINVTLICFKTKHSIGLWLKGVINGWFYNLSQYN